jgi:hypothetical protein
MPVIMISTIIRQESGNLPRQRAGRCPLGLLVRDDSPWLGVDKLRIVSVSAGAYYQKSCPKIIVIPERLRHCQSVSNSSMQSGKTVRIICNHSVSGSNFGL